MYSYSQTFNSHNLPFNKGFNKVPQFCEYYGEVCDIVMKSPDSSDKKILFQIQGLGMFQVVQCLRLCLPMQGVVSLIPGQGAKISPALWPKD